MAGMKRYIVGGLVLAFVTYAYYWGRNPAGTPGRKPGECPITKAEQDAVLDVFEEYGWPREEALRTVQLESGWRPCARNPNGSAAGLIQLTDYDGRGGAFRLVGWSGTPDGFARLTAREQLPYIDRYLARIGRDRWRVPGDTYLALAAPGFIGAADDTVIYPVGSAAWRANPGLQEPDGGPITAGSVRAKLLSRLQ